MLCWRGTRLRGRRWNSMLRGMSLTEGGHEVHVVDAAGLGLVQSRHKRRDGVLRNSISVRGPILQSFVSESVNSNGGTRVARPTTPQCHRTGGRTCDMGMFIPSSTALNCDLVSCRTHERGNIVDVWGSLVGETTFDTESAASTPSHDINQAAASRSSMRTDRVNSHRPRHLCRRASRLP